MLRLSPPFVLALAATTLVAGTPAVASAATMSIDRPCYAHLPGRGSVPIVVALTGGTPGANFLVAATVPGGGTGSAGSASGTFDGVGNAVTRIENVSPPGAGISPTAGRKVDLSVKDFGDGSETAGPSPRIANIAASIASEPRNIRRKRTVKASAPVFAGQRVYGFITKGTSPRVLRRVSLGTANVCGYVSRKAIVAPKGYRPGTYRLYINAGRKLSKRNAISLKFRIFRTFL